MDLEMDLGALDSKKSELESLTSKASEICDSVKGGYLNQLSSTEISSLSNNLKTNVERLQKGYKNCGTWFSNYLSELNDLESNLANMKSGDVTVEAFNKDFADLFTKVAVPMLTTEYRKEQEEKKKSGVLSYEVGKVPAPGVEAANIKREDAGGGRATLLDIQVNGVSLGQDGTITIKRGTTARLTVKFPDEIEGVQTCKRTNYDGASGWSSYVSQANDPMVNKNDSSTFVDTREYNWYITGNKTGTITLSQTALFSLTGKHKYGTYKGMARVRVKIVD